MSDDVSSLYLQGGFQWHPGAAPELTVPTDGRAETALMAFRCIFAGKSRSDQFPNQATLHLNYPAAAIARLDLHSMGNRWWVPPTAVP
ncbi:MAG: hypothetical protein J6386_18160 [Candidatus Synoicihabitans palmerolidicus]|nr:hypothetical protein [Candidatus Synoicihabitans palmerolidicus]